MQPSGISVPGNDSVLVIRRRAGDDCIAVLFNFGECEVSATFAAEPGRWRKLLDSSDSRWMGLASQLANDVFSDGTLQMMLNPNSVCFLQKAGVGVQRPA